MSMATNTVRVVIDGRIVEAQGLRRTTTLLDFLREHEHRTGTKEGCAEGDCGACVVLVGELDAAGKSVNYVPVNACLQLLPSVDGKSIKTVESLKAADGSLHPVQQALVGCHGSQCGFCTPGIVMSLAGLMQTVARPSRGQVTDALQGNLCRCTGYRPIVDAALQAADAAQARPGSLKMADEADLDALREIRREATPTYSLEGDLLVQPVVRTRKGHVFLSPSTVAEVAQALVDHPGATLLAGSTEVGLKVNKQHWRPEAIVYLGNVAGLREVKTSAAAWRIGAAVPLEQVMQLVAAELPDFAEVLRRFGSPPIRSTATLAGNIANGSPIGDTMPCLMALGASLTLRHGAKTRSVPLAQFYTGMKQNLLQPAEFIEAIELPRLNVGPQNALRHSSPEGSGRSWERPGVRPAGEIFRAHKISKRFDQDISATCAAIRYRLEGGRLKDVRLAFNGLTPYPARAPRLEALLEGQRPEDISATALDAAVADSFPARDGLRATWAYRALVARNLVLRFIGHEEGALA